MERDGIVMHAAEAESGGMMAAAAFPSRRVAPYLMRGWAARISHARTNMSGVVDANVLRYRRGTP